MGRPKKEISPNEMKKAEKYAYNQAQWGTICKALGWDDNTIAQRADIRQRLEQKKAQGKIGVLIAQGTKARNGDIGAMIWYGKQHLDQTDKQESKINAGDTPLVVVIGGKLDG